MGYWDKREGRYRLFSEGERREYGRKKAEEMREKWQKTYVSKSTLLKMRGWTEQGIFRFLAGKLVDAGPINAYRISVIEKIESSKAYKDFMLANPKGKRSKEPKAKKKNWWDDCIAKPVKVKTYFDGGVCMYETCCPRCAHEHHWFVSFMDSVIHGIAHLWRKCPGCEKRFWIKISIKSGRIAYRLD